MDDRFHVYKDCEINNIYIELPCDFSKKYLFEVAYKESDSGFFRKYRNLYIDSSNLLNELIKLRDDPKCTRLYFAHGMTDIDIYKYDGMYVIEYSPSDYEFTEYYITEENYNNIIKKLS